MRSPILVALDPRSCPLLRPLLAYGLLAVPILCSGLSRNTESRIHATEPKPTDDVAAVAASEKDWPLFRGDVQARGARERSLPEPLDLLWKFETPDTQFEGSAAIVDGVVYIGDMNGVIRAIGLHDGKVRWEKKDEQSESGFSTTPAVRDGRLFLGNLDGQFYGRRTDTGALIWKFSATSEINSSANFYKDGVLFGSQDANLYYLNVQNGDLIWKFTIEDQIRCSPTVVEDRAFVAGCDSRLHMVDLTNGKGAASVPIDSPTGVTAAAHGDRVFFGTEGGAVHAINWRKAESDWVFRDEPNRQSIRSSPAVQAGLVITGSRSKRIYALDEQTGEKRWMFSAQARVDGSPVVAGQRVYIGAANGRLFALHLNTGKVAWEYETGGEFVASPAVADGRLVIANTDGTIYCFGDQQGDGGQ